MAAFNFPNSPSLNQTHTDNGIVWKWNGSVWKRVEGVGAQGAQGYQGYQGVVGAQGVQGAQGHQGVQGAQGAQGVTGAQGHQGQVGAQGAQGAQGTPGSGGSAGAQGHQGHQGHQGNDGDDGSDGGAGAQGHQGHQGVPGSDGSDGSATISNNANDRIITGGSGTNLNGEANLQFNGTDLFVANDIKHLGDTDTYIEFTSDRIRLIAGGKALIDAIEAGTDSVTINEGGNDLDFRVEGQNDNHLISTDGANDRVGFSVGAPTEKVHIDGNVRITGAIKDKNNHAGSAGQVLSSTGTQLDWVEPSTLTYAVPAGGIIIWSGAANAIPSGWVLCNGSNSTPDLRGRFVVGYHNSDGDYDVNDYGGTASVTLSTSQIPAHSHDAGTLDADDDTHTHKGKNQSANASNANGHSVWVNDTHNGNYGSGSGSGGGPLGNRNFLEDNTHGHNISGSTGNRGGGGSHENRPPYYALCYIMKT